MELAVICLAVIGFAAVFCLRGMKKAPAVTRPNPGSGVPKEKEGDFAIGTAPGEDGMPVMYTLTTCKHCVHLKHFLDEHGIEHHLVYVDDFQGAARTAVMDVLRAHNPRGSFPTLIIPGGRTIVGFKRKEVCEAFNLPAVD